jgi:putative ubiquitin-RnfH superfamily antitoxin RatB of RatAB toxin-antitoxin module
METADRGSASPLHLCISLAYVSDTGEGCESVLTLPIGATLEEALQVSGLRSRVIDDSAGMTGIWGRRSGLQTVLANGDRVEFYQPLLVDPKLARRERFRQQGARTTGLFARQREGAKAGY